MIDDGSTDNTGDWIKGLGDPRIVYQWQENRFVNYARNRGMDRMRGDYAIFLDSDDKFSSRKSLAIMVETITNAPAHVGRVIFPADSDHHNLTRSLPANKTMLLNYAEYACKIKKLLAYGDLSITHSAIAKRFPWSENRADGSDARNTDIARHYDSMLVNTIVWHYQRDRSKFEVDNLGAFHGFVKQMPDFIVNVSSIIARHKEVWLANCQSVYADRCYEVAFFISLVGTLAQHCRLPRLLGAIVIYGNWRMRVKMLVLLATLLLPPSLRQKIYAVRYRIAHRGE